ncbi:MAG: hypothetical protein JSW28_06540, partial [Thermoplasmata archaeon]
MSKTGLGKIVTGLMVSMLVFSGYIVLLPTDAKADTRGPDGYGYVWMDSDSPSPKIQYNWVDISGMGGSTTAVDYDDDGDTFPIGFNFTFYGNNYTEVNIYSHGYINFGEFDIDYWQRPIPHPFLPNSMIAAFWENLRNYDGWGGSRIYLKTLGAAPFRILVVQWTGKDGIGNEINFEIILHETYNNITIQYHTMKHSLGSGIVGIENETGETGLQYPFGVHDGLAIEFLIPPHNLAVERMEAPDYYSLNQAFYVNASLVNVGTEMESGIEINFTVNGVLEDWDFVATLSPRQTYNVSFQYLPTERIDYLVEIAATPIPGEYTNKDNNKSKLVTIDLPTFGIHVIDPPYPNATTDVNATVRIFDRIGVNNATLWYSYDNSSWASLPMDMPGEPLFRDFFKTTTIDPSNWAEWGGYNGPVIDDVGIEEPSSLYSLHMDGNDYINSTIIDLSGLDGLSIDFWYEIGGGGDMPSSLDELHLQYYTSDSSWADLWITTGGSHEYKYTNVNAKLPSGCYHSNFQFRFVAEGSWITDDWFIDSVQVGRYFFPWVDIPGPGYTATVYFYVNATDVEGNTNESGIFTYYADGIPPEINYLTTVNGAVSSEDAVTIYALVSDDNMLDEVRLWYDNGSGWTSLPMAFVQGNGTVANYSAVIPPANAETDVFYYVDVFDVPGNQNISATESYLTNFPPTIAEIYHAPDYPNGSSTVTIYANITDSNGTSSATLYYSFDDGASYSPVAMSPVSASIYAGDIPPLGSSGWVFNYIDATDTLGLHTISSVYSYFVDAVPPNIGMPGIIVPVHPNDTTDVNVTILIEENHGISGATLSYSYDEISWNQLSLTALGGGTLFENDVESGLSVWSHYALTGLTGDTWTVSSAKCQSPENSWYSGGEQGTNWGDSGLEFTWSDTLPPKSRLSFWHWYDFALFRDGGLVEVNDGSGWSQIYPEDGYDTTI